MLISIAIPIYDMPNGQYFLERAIESITTQTFQDYEIIISDDRELQDYKIEHPKITVVRNIDEKGMANNTNNAIDNAKGEFIKILYQDDYLADERALERLAEQLQDKPKWLVTGCAHNENDEVSRIHMPTFQQEYNDIGSPSVLTIHNSVKERFNPKLTWVLDLEYYKKLYEKYGEPKFYYDTNVIIGIGQHQVTNLLTTQQKLIEELSL